jgi:alpha-methylacyl-CoA racemase
MNLVGDYGGGSTYLVMGLLAALLEARDSGQGQVVDAAIVDGSASLLALYAGRLVRGDWSRERGANMLDGAPHFYRCYETSDGRHMAVGAIEPQFYAKLCELLQIDPATVPQHERASWEDFARQFALVFRQRSQREWTELFAGTDACVAPVLPIAEAAAHPHLAHRHSYTDVQGVLQPAAAPRFSRSGQGVQGPPPSTLSTLSDVLRGWEPAADRHR